ncbi:MAG: hypothetical protein LIR46_04410 [Bacteroidota bacterium]|nr:hypothetical protein [Bacteroidota bacterium]
MAQNVIINGVNYQNVPEVNIPKSGGGTAEFYDISDSNLDNGNKMLDGTTAYGPTGTKYTGSIQKKAAATYTPTTSDQTIAAGQYLDGAQTVKGDANLVAGNIASGVSIFGVQGALSSATISQDSTTKVLSIS